MPIRVYSSELLPNAFYNNFLKFQCAFGNRQVYYERGLAVRDLLESIRGFSKVSRHDSDVFGFDAL